jgi:hypothetical protein
MVADRRPWNDHGKKQTCLWGIVWGVTFAGNKKGTQKISESLVYQLVAGRGFEPLTFGL